MERFWDLRKTHKKTWYGAWALIALALVSLAQWQFSGGNPILTQVLGAQAKKPDVTPPVVKITVPVSNGVYGPNSWTGRIAGTASDSSGIHRVEVKLGDGDWLQASGTTSWSLATTMPPAGGPYTVSARATDKAPAPNESNPVTLSYSIDDDAPAPPVISDGPEDPTIETSARFAFAGESGARFECQLDSGRFEPCSSPFSSKKVSVGDRSFRVVAVDAAGNRSEPSTPWSWTVLINKAFGISGDALGPVFPGGPATPLNLKISNPYNFEIEVVNIEVTAASTGDCAVDNLIIRSLDNGYDPAIVVPANSTATLEELQPPSGWPADWPTIAMDNTSGNQDACKNKTFNLSYRGTATKP